MYWFSLSYPCVFNNCKYFGFTCEYLSISEDFQAQKCQQSLNVFRSQVVNIGAFQLTSSPSSCWRKWTKPCVNYLLIICYSKKRTVQATWCNGTWNPVNESYKIVKFLIFSHNCSSQKEESEQISGGWLGRRPSVRLSTNRVQLSPQNFSTDWNSQVVVDRGIPQLL